MKKLILLFYVGFTVFSATAQHYVLSGRITDQKSAPIPFASVYIKNSTYGTTANENGDYGFKLKSGSYDVIFRFVGYKVKEERIIISGRDEHHDVQMADEPFLPANEKIRRSGKYDPGMDIMRQVIAKRQYYLTEVQSYSSTVYIKGEKRIISSPKTLLAKGIAKLLGLDTSGRGISYQSESLSDFNFERPNKVKEVFLASKVAGVNPPFGYNKASDLKVNFYKSLFYINGLNSHGFASPVGSFAFFYYRYKLLGSVIEDGKKIDKIEVIPRNGKALLFRGSIYIIEGDWRIYSVDLLLTKAVNNLNFVDTLRVSQQYIPVKDNVWMPLSFHYVYKGNVQGFRFSGYYLGINNNYKIDPTFRDGYFTGEILHVDTAANTKGSTFWDSARPVPLSADEIKDYKRHDSLAVLHGSPKYLDSIQHAKNKFKLFPYITHGYLATYQRGKDSLFIYPLLQTIYYNTVEGYGIYLKGRYSKTYADNRSLSLTPILRYGFANKLFSANLHLAYTYDQARAGTVYLGFGTDLLDLNSLGTRSLYFNTLSTLLSEQNFVKYYQSQFINLGFQRELTNGVLWMADISYANRTQLYNISYNHIFTYSDRHYTSNNPLVQAAPEDDRTELFPQNQALIFNTSFRFTFDQQYITRPTGKIWLPSMYPVITVNYRKGINGAFGSDVNYDFVSLDIEQDRIPLGIFGHSAFKIKAGGFLNRQTVYYMDYQHFLGNQGTTSDPTYVGSFHFLPFYTFSTDDPFLEAHYQHNFAGAILDNVPYLRRLKLEEIIGANYLTDKTHPNYAEFYFGIKRLVYGADYGFSYLGGKKYLQGFRIFYGLK